METIDLLSARVLRISDESRLQASYDAGLFIIESIDGVFIGPMKYTRGHYCIDCGLRPESYLTCSTGKTMWHCGDGVFVDCKK
jgi:hypothetical protein